MDKFYCKSLGVKKLWTQSTYTWAILKDKKIIDTECYDEHHNGIAYSMVPLSLAVQGDFSEISVPDYYAKEFIDKKLFRHIRHEGSYHIIAPIFYHPGYGAVFNKDVMDKIIEKDKKMKDFQDERLKELIAEQLAESLNKEYLEQCVDPAYVAYVMFCTLGSLIIKNQGPKIFEDYVSEIMEKNDM
jgi:hypothetical protein